MASVAGRGRDPTRRRPRLKRCAERLAQHVGGCQVLPAPIKSIARSLSKAQTEYEGKYTRILDYARVSIICETLGVMERCVQGLLGQIKDSDFGIEVVRIKDRISLDGGYDAEESGGNRDVLINGWLDLGMGKRMIVELQVHHTELFRLKGELHTVYDGARVLGVSEPENCVHAGIIDDEMLDYWKDG